MWIKAVNGKLKVKASEVVAMEIKSDDEHIWLELYCKDMAYPIRIYSQFTSELEALEKYIMDAGASKE